jgi:branched-chain amino acid transport system substrate-binding protein
MSIDTRRAIAAAVTAIVTFFGTGDGRSQEKPTYKLAYVGPITGPNTSVGVGTMNSIDLAVRQANARGDLPFKLEFVSETDDSKPAAGVAAIQKLCADKSGMYSPP